VCANTHASLLCTEGARDTLDDAVIRPSVRPSHAPRANTVLFLLLTEESTKTK